MIRKIIKYISRFFLFFLLVLLILPVLLYIPSVQNFIKKEAAAYVSKNFNITLSINRIRLSFPLDLAVDNTTATTFNGDTLFHCGTLKADVALLPLFRKEVVVNRFTFTETSLHYTDTLSQFDLKANVGSFALKADKVDLANEMVDLSFVELSDGKVALSMGESPADTTASDTVSVRWKINAKKLTLDNIDFVMDMYPPKSHISAKLQRGNVNSCLVDIGGQSVAVDEVVLDKGEYVYLSDTSKVVSKTGVSDTIIVSDSVMPWTVEVGKIELRNNAITYGALEGSAGQGLDINHIALSEVNLSVDSLFNRGSAVKVNINDLTFTERCGFQVEALSGCFEMDTSVIQLSDFVMKSPLSVFHADVKLGGGIMKMSPTAPVRMKLSANLDLSELLLLYPIEDKATRKVLKGRSLTLTGDVSGELDKVNIKKIQLSVPKSFNISVDGRLQSILHPELLNGVCRLNGRFGQMNDLLTLLPDSLLQKRVHIPDNLVLRSELKAVKGVLFPSLNLIADRGSLDLNGMYNQRLQQYELDLKSDSLPLYSFFPSDSLGLLTMSIQANGKGFDFYDEKTHATLSLFIDRLDYKGHEYEGISLSGGLSEHLLKGKIGSADEALQFGFDISGYLSSKASTVKVGGEIKNLDLTQMNLSKDKFIASLSLDVAASMKEDSSFTLNLAADSIKLLSGWLKNNINRTTLDISGGRESVELALRSGDMSLNFSSFVGLDSLMNGITKSSELISAQMEKGDINMEEVQLYLPPFSLDVEAAKNNIVNNFLKIQGVKFNNLSIESSSVKDRPFKIRMLINKLSSQGIILDTVLIGARQQEKQLDYFFRLANAAGNMDNMALMTLYGNVAENKLKLNCRQRDRNGRQGFNFGCNVTLLDSAVTLNLFPENPILGFDEWSVNKDNFFTYQFNRELYADIHLANKEQRVVVESAVMPDSVKGIVHLDIAGIDIDTTLSVFPLAPPVGGIFNMDLLFGLNNKTIDAKGKIGIDQLKYDKQLIGDIGFDLLYKLEQEQLLDAKLSLNDTTVLTAKGSYRTEGDDSLAVTVDIPSLPLMIVNAFVPAELARLSGFLKGNISVTGSPQKLQFNGGLRLAETSVSVPMIGTSFTFSDDEIVIKESKMQFANYPIISPNKNSLLIDGSVDISDFSKIMTDLSADASDFQLINVKRNRNSMVFGKANLDLHATVRGPIDELTIRGNAQLLNGTEIDYVLRDSPMEVKQEKQNIVTFVSFSDTTDVDDDEFIPQVKIGGMNVLVNVGIDSDVKMAVNLSEDGQNRINLQGGGNLTYTMNQLGDSRFSGKYILTGGTVRYNPPIISEKIFQITEGSFVEWNGDIADPTLNITAVETVKTNVAIDEQNSRTVKFNLSINIKNTLENLSITMDLAAPEDITIQNELSSLTEEERATQAMNLLIYNTYTGPGSNSKMNVSNPLNAFLQKELNQWAQNNLKNVDLSFGINTYNEMSGGTETSRTDYSYKLSKSLFDNRFRVIVGGRFSTDADPTENLKENLIDDISLEYVIGKRDNMFIKLFRHTGYESILEGEVIQTGVGFVVRKKLRKLRYLFRLTKGNTNTHKEKKSKEVEVEKEVKTQEE
ncbi:MAG: translocation/assembly module TamB domain-containing protein [Bacteroidales bacterium]|nr:translocation/assembly module TamB domain-containing protein [Bacteroidales bacterium]